MAKKEAPAVGIDLGTTYSRLGVWKDAIYSRLGVPTDGKVEIITNEQGNRATPSCVAFGKNGCLVGEEALNHAHRSPTNTIFDIKRLIGREFSDESVQSNRKLWPFTIVAGEAGKPSIVVEDMMGEQKHFSAEEISSRVLLQMKKMASTSLRSPVTKAVVTVPVYFNHSQREATKHACAIAGLEVLQILDEPIAAALAYSHHNKDMFGRGKKTILVFDLGGGKLDVSLVKLIEHGPITVIATSGDPHLGGQDFDNRMVQCLLKTIREKHNHDLSKNNGCIMSLKTSCEKAKRMLSSQPITKIEAFYRDEESRNFNRDEELRKTFKLSTTFTEARFAGLNKDLFDKCVGHVEQCLENAKMEKDSIDGVVLVGGSTRIPELQQMLQSFFEGKELYKSINVDEAVAYGASIQAAMLDGGIRPAPARKIIINTTIIAASGILTVTARKEDDNKEKGVTVTMSLDEVDRMIRQGRTNEILDKVKRSAMVTMTTIKEMAGKAPLGKEEEYRRPTEVKDAQGEAIREVPSKKVEEGETGEREEDTLGKEWTTESPNTKKGGGEGYADTVAEQSGDEGGTPTPGTVELASDCPNLLSLFSSVRTGKRNEGSTVGGPSREKGGDERRPPKKKDDGKSHGTGLGGGRSKEKAQEDQGPVVGIDLGTIYSRVAVVRDGLIRIIEEEPGKKSMRSCVAFYPRVRHIGEDDEVRAAFDAPNTIFAAKRLLGRRLSEETIQRCTKLWPFKVVAGEDDRPVIVVQPGEKMKHFHAEEISSMILSRMKDAAENFLRQPVSKAVVTVPAYFNDAQREATKTASAVAGFKDVRLLNDSSAAALAYGLRNEGLCRDGITRSILIFHLGGGTCDVSIVELDGHGALKVRAAAGDTHLGGEDFDNRLMDHFIDLRKDVQGRKGIRDVPAALRRLKAECEKAKKFISHSETATVCASSILPGINLYEQISRAKFEELNMDLFQRCFKLVQQCLDEAKMGKNTIHEVVLVGGSTLIPKIREMMKDFFNGKAPCCSLHATESVADGAAMLAGGTNQLVLVDVTRLSLRIETAGGDVIAEVPRNTPIPFTVEKAYTDPDCVGLAVYEGEKGLAEEKKILCRFEMHGLESKPRVLTIHIDEDGILMISARIAADKSSRLPRKEMDRMIEDAQRYKQELQQLPKWPKATK